MEIDKNERCYICGRTNEEVTAYLISLLEKKVQLSINQYTDRRDSIRNQSEKADKARERIGSIAEELDASVLRLKVSTIENDFAVFKEEYPDLNELMQLLNTTSRVHQEQTLSGAVEHAVAVKPSEEEKQSKDTGEVNYEIRYLEDLIAYQKQSAETQGRSFITTKVYQEHPFRQNSNETDTFKQLRRIAKELNLDFDTAYALADAIKQGIQRQGNSRTPVEERWTQIHDGINAAPEILAMLTLDVYRRFAHRAIGALPKIDEAKRQYFSREGSLQIPICNICNQLTWTPQN